MTQPPSEQEPKTSIRDVLDRLRRLQELDRRSADLGRQAQGGPAAVEALARAVKGADARLVALEEKRKLFLGQVRLRENDVKAQQQLIERRGDQARTVGTQKEFKAISAEIANARSDKKRIEDEILKIMEALEGLEKQIAAAREERAREQAKLDAEKSRLDASMASVEAERRALMVDRPTISAGIPAETLALYDRLVKARGNAIVAIESDTCTGCMELLTRQDLFAVRTASRIVPCKSCGRILYWP